MRTASGSWAWSFEIVPGHGPRFVPDADTPALIGTAMAPPKLILILSENWTMTSPRDLPSLVRFAVRGRGRRVRRGDGQRARGARARRGRRRAPVEPARLRAARQPGPDHALAELARAAVRRRGRDHPAPAGGRRHHPAAAAPAARWPRTWRRSICCREGRLVVQPTVSWHRAEYDALGVPFGSRGALLDEHLAAWERVVARHTGVVRRGALPLPRRVPRAEAVPPRRADALVRRQLAPRPVGRPHRHVRGRLQPLGPSVAAGPVATATRRWPRRAGASTSSRWWAGRAACSPIASSVADLAQALSSIPEQVAAGFTSICIKPSQFIDDAGAVGPVLPRGRGTRLGARRLRT